MICSTVYFLFETSKIRLNSISNLKNEANIIVIFEFLFKYLLIINWIQCFARSRKYVVAKNIFSAFAILLNLKYNLIWINQIFNSCRCSLKTFDLLILILAWILMWLMLFLLSDSTFMIVLLLTIEMMFCFTINISKNVQNVIVTFFQK